MLEPLGLARGFEVVEGDVTDETAVARALESREASLDGASVRLVRSKCLRWGTRDECPRHGGGKAARGRPDRASLEPEGFKTTVRPEDRRSPE